MAIAAIALGMIVMISATALITGFQNQISQKIFGFWGHIHIMHTNINRSLESVPISINQDFYPSLDTIGQLEFTERPDLMGFEVEGAETTIRTHGGIDHIQVFTNLPGIIKVKNEIEGIVLKGISTDFDWRFLNDYLVKGEKLVLTDTSETRDMIISQYTADRLKLDVEDKLVVYFVINGKQVPKRFQIKGIYKTGLEEYDKIFAIADMKVLQDIMGWEADQVGGFEVFVEDLRDLDIFNEFIYIEIIPNNLYAQSVKDKFPSIFEWLALQDVNGWVILGLMLVVSIVNMMTTLLILILERTNMIGILKSLGQSNWSIQKIFLYYAAYIIGLGLIIGNVVGLTLCFLQKQFGFIRLSEADYYLAVAPVEIDLSMVVLLNVGTLVITIIFLIIPSYLIARISPVKAIRFD